MTAPQVQQRPDGKGQADFFTSVRQRGILNTMLERPALKFEAENPGLKTRWEFWPVNNDMTLVSAREAMGYRVVDASEINTDGQDHAQKDGPVRVGDLVLMCAPEEIHNAILEADALAAEEDLRLPERAYRESLNQNKIKRLDGTEDQAIPTGSISVKHEVVAPKPS